MKNLKLSLTLAAAFAATQAHALIDASVFGGYSTLAMGDVNQAIVDAGENLKSSGNTAVTTTKFSGGFYTGVDLAFSIFPFLKIGPRVEFVQGTASNTFVNPSGTKKSQTYTANIMPLMLGLSADMGMPLSDLSFRAGIYGGYGLARFNTLDESGSSSSSSSASGGGFVAEIDAQLRYKIIPLISLGLDLGYRLANISGMKDDTSGQTFKKSNGSDMMVDYSGINAGLCLAFNF